MGRLLSFLMVAAAGCRTGAEPAPVQERVVLSSARPRGGEPEQPPEWFEAQIRGADEDLRTGRLEQGFEKVLLALEASPGPEHAPVLAELHRRLNQAVLDLPTLAAAIEPELDPISFGDPVRVRVRLRNPGTRTVRVRARPAGTSPSLFVLDLVRVEYDVRAQIVTTRRQVFYPLSRDLEIPPGGTSEIVFTVTGAGNERSLDGFRTFTLGGQLRGASVELDGLRRYEAVRIRPGTLRSFRPNYEHLTDDPLARVRQALERNAPIHLLTAAALVPPADRRAAVDALVDSLRGGGAMDYAAFASLEYLTNVDLGRDADAWRAWWPRVREGFFERPAPAAAGEGPRFARE